MKIKLGKLAKKLGRRLAEPSTLAGVAGVPGAAVVAAVLFPNHAEEITLVAPLVAGLLIGRKEKRTLAAEAND